MLQVVQSFNLTNCGAPFYNSKRHVVHMAPATNYKATSKSSFFLLSSRLLLALQLPPDSLRQVFFFFLFFDFMQFLYSRAEYWRGRASFEFQIWPFFSAYENYDYICSENEISRLVLEDCCRFSFGWSFHGVFYDQNRLLCENPPFRVNSSFTILVLCFPFVLWSWLYQFSWNFFYSNLEEITCLCFVEWTFWKRNNLDSVGIYPLHKVI